jgi:hypothetical protein
MTSIERTYKKKDKQHANDAARTGVHPTEATEEGRQQERHPRLRDLPPALAPLALSHDDGGAENQKNAEEEAR